MAKKKINPESASLSYVIYNLQDAEDLNDLKHQVTKIESRLQDIKKLSDTEYRELSDELNLRIGERLRRSW